MNQKTLLYISVTFSILIILTRINSVGEITQQIPLIKCFDYSYQVEFEESALPVEMNFYIIEGDKETYFKKDFAYDIYESTLLHCGHDYKVVYTFKDGNEFTDYITVPEFNPIISKVTKITIP